MTPPAAGEFVDYRKQVLEEMRRRRILAPAASAWTAEHYTDLLRAQEAEALGAISLLRSRLGSLRGLVIEEKRGNGYRELRLTGEGYRNFLFLLSQDARTYFESKGTEAKFVFDLQDLSGRKLFNGGGDLTQAGIGVYTRVKRGEAVFWKLEGKLNGTVRPPKPGEPLPKEALQPKKRAPSAAERAAELVRSGYIELSGEEYNHLLKETKLSSVDLAEQSSVQILPAGDKVFYFLAPADPLMALVSRRRVAAAKTP